MPPRFDVNRFEEMIDRRGRSFQWERARRCPCYDPRTRSPREACSLCFGLGYTYKTMGDYRATILGITGSKQWARFGEWLQGDAVMTFPSSLLIGDKDRITLTSGEFRESDVLVKGTNDTLICPNVLEVLECGDENRLYTVGRDFVLSGSTIVWRGLQPADGASYSVLYRALPVYVVWMQLPQIRAQVPTGFDDTGAAILKEMPRKVALRRWLDYVRPGGA